MSNKYYNLLLFIFLGILIGCDDEPEVIVKSALTPYKLAVPEWVDAPFPSPMDNPMTVEGIALGKRLFYDTRLSADNSMSCATCHMQQDGFSDKRTFSLGINGEKGTRQAMPIFNLAWNESFFWDGRAPSLEAQAHDPVTNPIEMNNSWENVITTLQKDKSYVDAFEQIFGKNRIDETMVTRAIAQFERSITSFNSKFDRYFYQKDSTALNSSEKRGFDIFVKKADCGHCHTGILLSDNTLRNNGLDVILSDIGQGFVSKNESDNGKFKVTTLRNIAFTSPYMHDGRFKTLEEVIEHYFFDVKPTSPNIDPSMLNLAQGLLFSEQDKIDLVAFLKTLSDSTLLNNSAYRKQ